MMRRFFDAAWDIEAIRRLQVGDVAMNGMMSWNGLVEGAAADEAINDLVRFAALESRATAKRKAEAHPLRAFIRAATSEIRSARRN